MQAPFTIEDPKKGITRNALVNVKLETFENSSANVPMRQSLLIGMVVFPSSSGRPSEHILAAKRTNSASLTAVGTATGLSVRTSTGGLKPQIVPLPLLLGTCSGFCQAAICGTAGIESALEGHNIGTPDTKEARTLLTLPALPSQSSFRAVSARQARSKL